MPEKIPGKKGFTFVEVMLVVSLVTVVGLAVYTSFSHGLRIWGRGQDIVAEEDVFIFLEKLSLELRNSFVFSQVAFNGETRQLMFPGVFQSGKTIATGSGGKEYPLQVGAVGYSFDPLEKIIYKQQLNYGQVVNKVAAHKVPVVRNVQNIKFGYVPRSGSTLIEKFVSTKELPRAVYVEVELLRGKTSHKIKKYIRIPTAG